MRHLPTAAQEEQLEEFRPACQRPTGGAFDQHFVDGEVMLCGEAAAAIDLALQLLFGRAGRAFVVSTESRVQYAFTEGRMRHGGEGMSMLQEMLKAVKELKSEPFASKIECGSDHALNWIRAKFKPTEATEPALEFLGCPIAISETVPKDLVIILMSNGERMVLNIETGKGYRMPPLDQLLSKSWLIR